MLFNSFLDEIEKIAARKLTRSQMLEVLDRLNPTEKSFNRLLTKNPDIDKVRRSYREALRMGDETLEVPLAERLRNYKEIKRTGQMPRIDDMTDYDFGVVAGEPSGLYMNLSDEAPVEMFSGGKVESLRRAVKNPKTRSNTDVLVPGRLRTERGLYFTPSRGSAKSYSEMPREADRVVGTTGRPAILSAKLPRRRVITNAPDAAGATEAFITAKDLKKAKTKISHLLLRAGDLEKIAAGPHIIEVDYPSGKFIPRDVFMKQMEAHPEARAEFQEKFPEVFKNNKDVVFVPSKRALVVAGVAPEDLDSVHKAYRRHELTHWSRARKGKMKGVGKPGLRNVLRTAREELVAYTHQIPRDMPEKSKKHVIQNLFPLTSTSVRENYAPTGGVKKAILGGSLSKPARIARKLLKR